MNSFKCGKPLTAAKVQTLLRRIAVPSSVGLESTTEVSFSLQKGHIIDRPLITIYWKRCT